MKRKKSLTVTEREKNKRAREFTREVYKAYHGMLEDGKDKVDIHMILYILECTIKILNKGLKW